MNGDVKGFISSFEGGQKIRNTEKGILYRKRLYLYGVAIAQPVKAEEDVVGKLVISRFTIQENKNSRRSLQSSYVSKIQFEDPTIPSFAPSHSRVFV